MFTIHLLVYFARVTFEGEHASAAGQVPLLDGGVGGPGDDVTIVDEHARDVTLVASRYMFNTRLDCGQSYQGSTIVNYNTSIGLTENYNS